MRKYLPYLAVITAMLIWSASGIATKIALGTFTPMQLIVVRFLLSVTIMFCVGMLLRRNAMFGLQRLERKDVPLFVLAGIAQPFLYYVLETYSYRFLSSPTIAEALLSTSPLLSPLFALVLLRERVTIYNIVGIIVSSIGVLLLIFVGSTHFALGNPWGVALAFAAVSSAVLYTIALRRVPSHYNALSIVFYVQLVSLLFFIPTWLVVDQPIAAASQLIAEGSSVWGSLGRLFSVPEAIASVFYLAAFSSVAAFILFCYTVRQLGVTLTNAFNNARPVFTALIMFLFFGEHLPLWKWVGILLIIIGLFVCQKTSKKS